MEKLPDDVKKFLFDKYYTYSHKKDSDWAKDLLVKYGCLTETDRRLPADVRWFLSELSDGTVFTVDETKERAKSILSAYPVNYNE